MKESFEDKMNDKFRKALESYQAPYDRQAWERLRGELPVKPEHKWKWWRLWGGLAFGFLAAGLIVYLDGGQTMKPNKISQHGQNLVSGIVKNGDAQSDIATSHPAAFGKKSQLIGEPSMPQETLGRGLMAKADPVHEEIKSSSPASTTPNKEAPEINDYELLSPKAGLLSTPGKGSKRIGLPAKKVLALETKKQKIKLRLPKFNIDFSGDRYSHFVGPNKVSVFYNPEFDLENTLRNPGLAHGLGIEFEGPINPTINLAVGLNYFSKPYSGSETFRLDSVIVSGVFVPFIDSTITRAGRYQFLEIPVSFRLKLLSGQRSTLFLDGGFSAIAFLNQEYNTHTVVNLKETDFTAKQKGWIDLSPFGSLNLGLTYRYALSERFSIGVSFGYKNHLSNLGLLPMGLDRFSGKIGLVYRFGREDTQQ